ncbi:MULTISPECIES: hypothetical protein [Pseudomonas syringae group]|uniref:Uncharacterized protein n=4 Tax=Pseudomonas syringae group TaxID=136849 RepID=A0A2K4WNA4_PSESX|nr:MULTISPECIES: hypothetical protein [Pseudomonas syringae group]AVB17114.1 hypothetical protein BKM19_028800 [Pseudomonas amygdali pv. morsprunorum]KPW97573.1 Uncharacterized protein ALO79_04124 [Pseudomonas syringae pv. castaneae]KWS56255.1 hypothetical protein AL056_02865 [Pseudomonas amygdali pv. morsprunorum]KWS66447.1 hypothetical protein AL054_24685 [Pseudomonas amygdali pv. morsprunorum]KWS89342.1 hypothetical protein AL048_09640 [Pseudomonas syringae pv. castaneae]
MVFKDGFVNRDLMFSLGIEETSGRFYLSFPVSNGLVDYEEYYEIDKASFDLFHTDLIAADAFATTCRRRERDDLLIQKPGAKRGAAIWPLTSGIDSGIR